MKKGFHINFAVNVDESHTNYIMVDMFQTVHLHHSSTRMDRPSVAISVYTEEAKYTGQSHHVLR